MYKTINYLQAKQSLSEIFTGSACCLLEVETFTIRKTKITNWDKAYYWSRLRKKKEKKGYIIYMHLGLIRVFKGSFFKRNNAILWRCYKIAKISDSQRRRELLWHFSFFNSTPHPPNWSNKRRLIQGSILGIFFSFPFSFLVFWRGQINFENKRERRKGEFFNSDFEVRVFGLVKGGVDFWGGFSVGKEIVLANETFLICGKRAQVQVIRMTCAFLIP